MALTVACLSALLSIGLHLAAPPIVVESVPLDGDDAVDPALATLRITFDQPMSPAGFSLCGGGPTFPELLGRPRWASPTELVVDVRLKPSTDYAFTVNCPGASNTRSVRGEAARVEPIRFRTRAERDAPPPPLTAEANEEAIRRLRHALEERYAYRDRPIDGVPVHWMDAVDAHAASLRRAQTKAAFAHETARLLANARDLHVSVAVGAIQIATHRREALLTMRPDRMTELVPGWRDVGGGIAIGRFDDGILYLECASWMPPRRSTLDPNGDAGRSDRPAPEDAAFLAPLLAAIDGLERPARVIIDVRRNGGGDERLARLVAARFLPAGGAGVVYARNRIGPRGAEGEPPLLDRILEPMHGAATHNGQPIGFDGDVAVLMGPTNMSACESFLLMMRATGRARLFGERSGGSSGNPKPHDLGNGVTVLLSSWRDYTPAGELIEGVGIAPDESVRFHEAGRGASHPLPGPPEAEGNRPSEPDPVLAAALRWLRRAER